MYTHMRNGQAGWILAGWLCCHFKNMPSRKSTTHTSHMTVTCAHSGMQDLHSSCCVLLCISYVGECARFANTRRGMSQHAIKIRPLFTSPTARFPSPPVALANQYKPRAKKAATIQIPQGNERSIRHQKSQLCELCALTPVPHSSSFCYYVTVEELRNSAEEAHRHVGTPAAALQAPPPIVFRPTSLPPSTRQS